MEIALILFSLAALYALDRYVIGCGKV